MVEAMPWPILRHRTPAVSGIKSEKHSTGISRSGRHGIAGHAVAVATRDLIPFATRHRNVEAGLTISPPGGEPIPLLDSDSDHRGVSTDRIVFLAQRTVWTSDPISVIGIQRPYRNNVASYRHPFVASRHLGWPYSHHQRRIGPGTRQCVPFTPVTALSKAHDIS